MTTVREIQQAVRRLPPQDLAQFRDWLADYVPQRGNGCHDDDLAVGAATRSGDESACQPAAIISSPRVCGGAARIAGTRIPVWMVELARREGVAEDKILEMYPWLREEQLRQAWAYADSHVSEIDAAIRENQDA